MVLLYTIHTLTEAFGHHVSIQSPKQGFPQVFPVVDSILGWCFYDILPVGSVNHSSMVSAGNEKHNTLE